MKEGERGRVERDREKEGERVDCGREGFLRERKKEGVEGGRGVGLREIGKGLREGV